MFITWNGETQNEYYGNTDSLFKVAMQLVNGLKRSQLPVVKAVVLPRHRMAKITYLVDGQPKHVTVAE